MTIDTLLWFGSIVGECLALSILLRKRVYRSFPVLTLYLAWTLISDLVFYFTMVHAPKSYFAAYLIETIIDSLLQVGVLLELAWSILRPIRKSLPSRTILVLAFLLLLAFAATWPFIGHLTAANTHLSFNARLYISLEQTISVLRILFFLALTAFSQLLAIGWRDRELQIASGLGFYSLISLAISALHANQYLGASYHWLDELRVGCYLGTLLYWSVSFSRAEPERKEFTPQMEKILLQIAGASHANRIALAGHGVSERSVRSGDDQ